MRYLFSLILPLFCCSTVLAEKPIQVVATTGMIADIVQNIAGERAQVKGLMGPGIDPHLYKPTRSDIATLSKAGT